MLSLDLEPTFWAPVDISVPGRKKPVTVEFHFKAMSHEPLQEWINSNATPIDEQPKSPDEAGANGGQSADAGDQKKRFKLRADIDILMDVCLDWKAIDGVFNRENLQRLINNYQASSGEIYRTYLREQRESKTKN